MSLSIIFALLLSAAHAGPITLSASDGVAIRAQSVGKGERGVVLVHDEGRSAEDWKAFADRLAVVGFRVVSVDLRGHGATGGALADEDYLSMAHDVSAAASWLSNRGATEILVVGAGLGGNVALNAAAQNEAVSGVAVLTPALNVRGVKAASAVAALDRRPLLLMADASDAIASRAADLLAQRASGPVDVKLYKGAGAGVRMFNGAPDLEGELVGWLNGSWRDDAVGAGRDLQAGEVGEVETRGTRMDERRNR